MKRAIRGTSESRQRRHERPTALAKPALVAISVLLIAMLAACGKASSTTGGAVQSSATATTAPTTTPASKGIGALSSTPPASQVPASPAPSAAPASAASSASAVPLPSAQPSAAPSAAASDTAAPSAVPSAVPSAAPPVAPSAAPPVVPPAPPASAAPSSQPSQPLTSIPTTAQACPEAYPWATYIGPEGQKWYRNPNSVAIFNRQPPTRCFVTEAAAQAVGYVPDPRPARATKSTDGNCPQDNPVKGWTNILGQQVYIAPGQAGYPGQKATDCFSDTGIAEYYGFKPAIGAAPSASAKPSAAPSASASAKPSVAPSASAKPSSAPAANLTPTTIDFGAVAIGGTSTAHILTLTNTGTQTIQVRTLDWKIEGSDAAQFSLKFDGCNAQAVAPGGTCTFTLTFRPVGTAGPRNATIFIQTGAGPSTTTTFVGTAK